MAYFCPSFFAFEDIIFISARLYYRAIMVAYRNLLKIVNSTKPQQMQPPSPHSKAP
jgi:hypothetical protein